MNKTINNYGQYTEKGNVYNWILFNPNYCESCNEGFFHRNINVKYCRDCTLRKRSQELKVSLKEINKTIYNTHAPLIWIVILSSLFALLSELIIPISGQDKSLTTLFWILSKWGGISIITLLLSNKINKAEKSALNRKQKEIQNKYPFEREGENL